MRTKAQGTPKARQGTVLGVWGDVTAQGTRPYIPIGPVLGTWHEINGFQRPKAQPVGTWPDGSQTGMCRSLPYPGQPWPRHSEACQSSRFSRSRGLSHTAGPGQPRRGDRASLAANSAHSAECLRIQEVRSPYWQERKAGARYDGPAAPAGRQRRHARPYPSRFKDRYGAAAAPIPKDRSSS